MTTPPTSQELFLLAAKELPEFIIVVHLENPPENRPIWNYGRLVGKEIEEDGLLHIAQLLFLKLTRDHRTSYERWIHQLMLPPLEQWEDWPLRTSDYFTATAYQHFEAYFRLVKPEMFE